MVCYWSGYFVCRRHPCVGFAVCTTWTRCVRIFLPGRCVNAYVCTCVSIYYIYMIHVHNIIYMIAVIRLIPKKQRFNQVIFDARFLISTFSGANKCRKAMHFFSPTHIESASFFLRQHARHRLHTSQVRIQSE